MKIHIMGIYRNSQGRGGVGGGVILEQFMSKDWISNDFISILLCMLGFPAKEKFREKCKISQTFREILLFFIKTNLAKGNATMWNFVKKLRKLREKIAKKFAFFAKFCNNLFREKKRKFVKKLKLSEQRLSLSLETLVSTYSSCDMISLFFIFI